MGNNPAVANFEAMARANMDMFENAMRMFSPFGAAAPAADAPAKEAPKKPAAAQERSELDSLKTQLEAMQAQLSKLAGKD